MPQHTPNASSQIMNQITPPCSHAGSCSSPSSAFAPQAREGTAQQSRVPSAQHRRHQRPFCHREFPGAMKTFSFLEISHKREFWSKFWQSQLTPSYRRDTCHHYVLSSQCPRTPAGPRERRLRPSIQQLLWGDEPSHYLGATTHFCRTVRLQLLLSPTSPWFRAGSSG